MRNILIAVAVLALAACSGNGTATNPVTPQAHNVNATSWALTPQSATVKSEENDGNVSIAQATFTYTQDQTIYGVPDFCYPITLKHAQKYTYYVSESDTLAQYNTNNLIGAGHATADESQVCFAANSTIHYAKTGGAYTLTLYGVPSNGD